MTPLLSQTSLHDTLRSVFDTQRQHARQMALTTAGQRIERIRRIQDWVNVHQSDIERVMYDDFRKPAA